MGPAQPCEVNLDFAPRGPKEGMIGGEKWSFGRAAGEACLLAIIVFAAAYGAMEFTRGTGHVAPVWLANAVVLGVLLSSDSDDWPAFILAGSGALLAANFVSGASALLAFGFTVTNMAEPVLAAILIQTGGRLSDRWLMERPQLVRFITFGVLLTPAACALAGTALINLYFGGDFSDTFWQWFAADALGVALVVPLVLLVRQTRWREFMLTGDLSGTLIHIGITAMITLAVFWQTRFQVAFFPYAVLVMAAFRLQPAGAAINCFVLAAISIGMTAAGHGPFALADGTNVMERSFILQFYLIVAIITSVPISVAVAERRELEVSLRSARDELRDSRQPMHSPASATGAPSTKCWTASGIVRCAAANRFRSHFSTSITSNASTITMDTSLAMSALPRSATC